MEIPPAPRPVLKDHHVRQITYTIIIASTIIIWSLILSSLRGCTGAPGARSCPHQSQNGKLRISDRGGSSPDPRIFEHNVYFPIRDEAKLFPKLRPAWIDRLQVGKPKNVWLVGVNLKSFNII